MIPSARPTVPPVAIIIFKQRLFVLFWDILKSGDERVDGGIENVRKLWSLPAEWINK